MQQFAEYLAWVGTAAGSAAVLTGLLAQRDPFELDLERSYRVLIRESRRVNGAVRLLTTRHARLEAWGRDALVEMQRNLRHGDAILQEVTALRQENLRLTADLADARLMQSLLIGAVRSLQSGPPPRN